MKGWLLGLSIAALMLVSAGGLGQVNHWSDGDVEIVSVHPDLQVESDGAVHSSGDFFAQSVLRGEDAGEVDEVSFSFGVGPPSPVYHPGYVGLWDYRADDVGEDGWIIPITAADQRDGEFKFAAHAYTQAGDPTSEIARLWGAAVVDNEGGDDVGPWPAIQPGETQQTTNPHGVRGVTVEFAENASAELYVDGEQVELQEWEPPARDDDDIPRHTEETRVLGDGYRWDGDVQPGTVLRVDATDQVGNEITKGALVGHGIDVPVVEIRLVEPATGLEPGDETGLDIEVANHGLQPADPAVDVRAPDGWLAVAQLPEAPWEPGQTMEGELLMEIPEDADPTGVDIDVEATYAAGGENVTSTFSLSLGQEEAAGPDAIGEAGPAGGTTGEDLEQQADVPAESEEGIPLGPGSGLLALLATAWWAGRSRDDR